MLLGALAYMLQGDPPPLASDPDPAVATALALGLDVGDALIDRRLLQDMAFMGYTGSDRALLSEARRLGLHRSDAVVRRHLALKLADQMSPPPTAGQLQEQRVTLCVQAAQHRIAEQPDRWLTDRDLERQYPDQPPEILESRPEQAAGSASCQARARAAAQAEARSVWLTAHRASP
jgi:hypothetical protein